MAKGSDKPGESLDTENTGGVLSGFLAEEDEFDRRALWRLGSWAVGSVGAVIVALLANQSSIGWRHEQFAAADLIRQSQQIQTVARESQNEAKRLASAIDTLNSDRDRLYSRIGVLEQGLDSVTGTIARQNGAAASPQAATAPATPPAAAAPPLPVSAASPAGTAAPTEAKKTPPAPAITPVATTSPAVIAPPTVTATAEKPPAAATASEPPPAAVSSMVQGTSAQGISQGTSQGASNGPAAVTPATPAPLMASKSMMGPPDPAAGKLIEPSTPPKTATTPPTPEVVASAPPAAEEAPAATESQPKVQRTEFGVDVGGANSVGGLRALWRGLLKSRANAPLAALRPIIMIKESNTGLGMQLRLVAGPLTDAAAAAKICAGMLESQRPCETTVFDGQRLALNGNESPAPPTATKPAWHRHSSPPKHVEKDDPPKKPEPSTLSLIFGRSQ